MAPVRAALAVFRAGGGTAPVNANPPPFGPSLDSATERGSALSTYAYEARRARNRPVETMIWLLTGIMVAFVLMSTFHPAVKQHMSRNPATFTVGLVVIYLMFLLFSRRIFRRQRLTGLRLVTTRRNFTFHDVNGEHIHSWRDVKDAELRVEVDARGQAYVRRFVMQVPKSTVRLDNDPAFPLPHADTLVAELRARLPKVRWSFHWFHPICPLCKGRLDPPARRCADCGEPISYVSKLMRPWEMLREEALYVALLLFVIAPSWPPLYLGALAFLAAIPLWSMMRARPGALRPLKETSETGDDATSNAGASTPTAAVVVSLVGGLLCLALAPVSAAPASPSPAPSSTVAQPSPASRPASSAPPSLFDGWFRTAPTPETVSRLTDASYFPLAVGNTWEYRSSYEPVVMRVSHQEIVNGTSCFVIESRVGEAAECAQREYYAVGPTGLEVYKRVVGGSEFFLDTPEPMIKFPAREGAHWTWQSTASQGSVMLAFEIKGTRRTNVLGRDRTALLVVVRGRSIDGSEIQTKRWYCRGIGMVREQSTMKKAGKMTIVESTLQNYSLRVGPPDTE